MAFLLRFEQSEEHIPPGNPTEETSQWEPSTQLSLRTFLILSLLDTTTILLAAAVIGAGFFIYKGMSTPGATIPFLAHTLR